MSGQQLSLDDLHALLGEGCQVEIAGTTVAVHAVRFGQIARVLQLLGPVLDDLKFMALDPEPPPLVAYVHLLAERSEVMVPLLAELTGLHSEIIERLPPDVAWQLIEAVLEVNADFFAQRLMPMLGPSIQRLTASLSSSVAAANQQAQQASAGQPSPSS